MPARFHFDLENGKEAIRDEQGVVADDLHQAIEQGAGEIEALRASGEFDGAAPGWHLVIRDAGGTELKRFPIS